MTEDAFVEKYRVYFMGVLADAACMRRLPASDVGMALEGHFLKLDQQLRQMFRDATREVREAKPNQAPGPVAGSVGPQQRKAGG
jgi:uncharacterized protein YbgA (DUF1722 family)